MLDSHMAASVSTRGCACACACACGLAAGMASWTRAWHARHASVAVLPAHATHPHSTAGCCSCLCFFFALLRCVWSAPGSQGGCTSCPRAGCSLGFCFVFLFLLSSSSLAACCWPATSSGTCVGSLLPPTGWASGGWLACFLRFWVGCACCTAPAGRPSPPAALDSASAASSSRRFFFLFFLGCSACSPDLLGPCAGVSCRSGGRCQEATALLCTAPGRAQRTWPACRMSSTS